MTAWTYRLNPATGRIAEQIPAEFRYRSADRPEATWVTWEWQPGVGLTVHLVTDADVADWVPREV